MKNVSISSTTSGGFKVEEKAHKHDMIVDQPVTLGGKDESPSPLEYLLTALGSCRARRPLFRCLT